MAKLAEYKRKRDPKKTPEPFGGKKRGKEPIFVVQRHDARSLHYDFRLERNGALASWAVPKGIPLEPGQQHLAVHVEDHPLEYATFEGEIPKGEYGAGSVEIWDKGTYELLEEKKNGGLTVRLHGERLNGTYALVPAHLSGDEKNWLILRKKDEAAPVARKPRRYAPMLATLADKVPRGDDWIYEIKWDGYRIIATVAGGEPELRTRKDQDYTKRFENVAKELVKALKTPGLRRRRRGLRPGRPGPAELLGHAAGQGRHADRLLRLRPARGGGRADRRPPARGAARAAREAARQAEQDRALLGEPSRTETRSWQPRRSRASKGSWPSGSARATCRAGGLASG